jgi:hypothetical protein
MTAISTAIYEDDVTERADESPDTYLERIHKETKGVETIERNLSVHARYQRQSLSVEPFSA